MSEEFLKACYDGDIDKVKHLLESETINFNATDTNGKTGFYLACEGERLLIVDILLKNSREKQIFLNLPNNEGKTPLHIACEKQNEDLIALIIHENTVNKLGIDRTRKDKNGKTAFEYFYSPEFESKINSKCCSIL